MEDYDTKLVQADLILGNLNVSVNKYSTYGKTKESGTAFAMIRVAKPGLLPLAYQTMDELKSSTINFKSYDDAKKEALKDKLFKEYNDRINKVIVINIPVEKSEEFLKVLDLVKSFDVPIVGHNLLIDLAFLMSTERYEYKLE